MAEESAETRPPITGGEVWMNDRKLPFGDAAIDAVLDCFVCELPQTARMFNCGALVHELIFGKDAPTPENEEDGPNEGVYAYFQGLLDGLAASGVLQVHEDADWKEEDKGGVETNIKAYSLSRESMLIYNAVRRAPLITTVPELVDSYNAGTLCRAAADTIAHLVENRG